MQPERIVIVGGGPAGFATARSYREAGGKATVTLIGEEPRLPYERPPLTKELLRGGIEESELPIEDSEWFTVNDVELRLGTTVTGIDLEGGVLAVSDGDDLVADAIVLATGSEPIRPDVPGIDHSEVLTMRRLPDALELSRRLESGEPVVVIGTGFIGCEIAGSLALAGAHVTLIGQELLPQLERLGEPAAKLISAWLAELDVELISPATVCAIHDGRFVELQDGRRLPSSHVVLGTGVRPRGELAQAAGLVMSDGAVIVDEHMRCAQQRPAILAAGDLALAYNLCAKRHLRVEHWGDALGQGEVAGHTLAGASKPWEEVPGFWSTIGERTLKYAAWGDGFDECRCEKHSGGAFTIWYSRERVAVGVLTHECDEDYERGRELIARGAPIP
jgi:3-phenylpropionate/trans-cinnamate dioxygenase ferredoxin reductase component